MRVKWNRQLDGRRQSEDSQPDHIDEMQKSKEIKKKEHKDSPKIFRLFRRKKPRTLPDNASLAHSEDDSASINSVASQPVEEVCHRDRTLSLFSSFRLSFRGGKKKSKQLATADSIFDAKGETEINRYSSPDLRREVKASHSYGSSVIAVLPDVENIRHQVKRQVTQRDVKILQEQQKLSEGISFSRREPSTLLANDDATSRTVNAQINEKVKPMRRKHLASKKVAEESDLDIDLKGVASQTHVVNFSQPVSENTSRSSSFSGVCSDEIRIKKCDSAAENNFVSVKNCANGISVNNNKLDFMKATFSRKKCRLKVSDDSCNFNSSNSLSSNTLSLDPGCNTNCNDVKIIETENNINSVSKVSAIDSMSKGRLNYDGSSAVNFVPKRNAIQHVCLIENQKVSNDCIKIGGDGSQNSFEDIEKVLIDSELSRLQTRNSAENNFDAYLMQKVDRNVIKESEIDFKRPYSTNCVAENVLKRNFPPVDREQINPLNSCRKDDIKANKRKMDVPDTAVSQKLISKKLLSLIPEQLPENLINFNSRVSSNMNNKLSYRKRPKNQREYILFDFIKQQYKKPSIFYPYNYINFKTLFYDSSHYLGNYFRRLLTSESHSIFSIKNQCYSDILLKMVDIKNCSVKQDFLHRMRFNSDKFKIQYCTDKCNERGISYFKNEPDLFVEDEVTVPEKVSSFKKHSVLTSLFNDVTLSDFDLHIEDIDTLQYPSQNNRGRYCLFSVDHRSKVLNASVRNMLSVCDASIKPFNIELSTPFQAQVSENVLKTPDNVGHPHSICDYNLQPSRQGFEEQNLIIQKSDPNRKSIDSPEINLDDGLLHRSNEYGMIVPQFQRVTLCDAPSKECTAIYRKNKPTIDVKETGDVDSQYYFNHSNFLKSCSINFNAQTSGFRKKSELRIKVKSKNGEENTMKYNKFQNGNAVNAKCYTVTNKKKFLIHQNCTIDRKRKKSEDKFLMIPRVKKGVENNFRASELEVSQEKSDSICTFSSENNINGSGSLRKFTRLKYSRSHSQEDKDSKASEKTNPPELNSHHTQDQVKSSLVSKNDLLSHLITKRRKSDGILSYAIAHADQQVEQNDHLSLQDSAVLKSEELSLEQNSIINGSCRLTFHENISSEQTVFDSSMDECSLDLHADQQVKQNDHLSLQDRAVLKSEELSLDQNSIINGSCSLTFHENISSEQTVFDPSMDECSLDLPCASPPLILGQVQATSPCLDYVRRNYPLKNKDDSALKKSRIPTKQSVVRPTKAPVRPPMWLSKAELTQEIQRLSNLCEARTKELNRLKMETKHVTVGFDAFAALFKYMVEDINGLSVPVLSGDLKKTLKQLELTKQDLAFYEREVEELKAQHCLELDDLSNRLYEVFQGEFKDLNGKHEENMKQLLFEHQKQVDELSVTFNSQSTENTIKHETIISELQKELIKQREELQIFQEREIADLEEKHIQSTKILQEHIEQLQKKCAEFKQHSQGMEEAMRKDTNTKLQWVTSVKSDLDKEVESLKTVLELRNNELRTIRVQNLEMEKQLEELPLAREKIKMLQARAEDLEALMVEKTNSERKLLSENQDIRDTYEKEAKVNRRISMEKDELLWRLKQAEHTISSSFSEFPEYEEEIENGTVSPQRSPTKSPTPHTVSRSTFFTFVDKSDVTSSPRTQYKKISSNFSSNYKTSPAKSSVLSFSPSRNKSHSEPPQPALNSTPKKTSKFVNRQQKRSGSDCCRQTQGDVTFISLTGSMTGSECFEQKEITDTLESLDNSSKVCSVETLENSVGDHAKEVLQKEVVKTLERTEKQEDFEKPPDIIGSAEVPGNTEAGERKMSHSQNQMVRSSDPKSYYHMTFPVDKEAAARVAENTGVVNNSEIKATHSKSKDGTPEKEGIENIDSSTVEVAPNEEIQAKAQSEVSTEAYRRE